MKYKKGEFTTVPNVRSLSRISATAQALFLWVCIYADEDGQCFPSRNTLADNLNCSVRTVDQYLKELCDAGFIVKTHRYNGNEKTTNLYQIMQVVVQDTAQPSADIDTTPSAESAHRTKSIITKPTYPHEAIASGEIVEVKDDDGSKNKTTRAAKTVASIFKETTGRYQSYWLMRTNQRQAAENLLNDIGVEQIRKALEFYWQNREHKYCPKITSPLQLEEKWFALKEFRSDLNNGKYAD